MNSGRWPTVQIRRLFRVQRGGTPSADEANWDGQHVWITPEDLAAVDGRVIADSRRRISDQGLASCSATLSPPSSLALSTRAPIGYIAQTMTCSCTNQGCFLLEPQTEVDSRYFRYQLLSRRAELQSLGQGSTFMELSTDTFAALSLVRPSLEEQRAIANFLDRETARIDILISGKGRLASLLLEREGSIRENWASDCFARFGETRLRRLTRRLEQGWSPPCDNEPAEPDEWAVLKTSAVSSGAFRPHENKRLPPDVEPDLCWEVKDGDLLVVRGSGSIESVAQAAVAQTEGRRLLLSDLLYRAQTTEQDAHFLAQILRSRRVRGLLEAAIRTDVGQTLKVRRDDLLDLNVPDADRNQQRRLVADLDAMLGPIRAAIGKVERQIGLLAEHRHAIITAAVTGQIDIAA